MPLNPTPLISANVRAELSRAGIRQHAVGALLALSQSAVSARLRGETPFRADELALLADRLGVPVARFYEQQKDEQTEAAS